MCVCVDVPILSEIAVSTMPRLSLAGCEAAGYLLSCHLERPYSKQWRVQADTGSQEAESFKDLNADSNHESLELGACRSSLG